jgi:hypothetical protein
MNPDFMPVRFRRILNAADEFRFVRLSFGEKLLDTFGCAFRYSR